MFGRHLPRVAGFWKPNSSFKRELPPARKLATTSPRVKMKILQVRCTLAIYNSPGVIARKIVQGSRPFVQPLRYFARHLTRSLRPTGALGVIVLFIGMLGAVVVTLRHRIIMNVRSCACCYGYGIQRCTLCGGRGVVGWEGKWLHKEPCPMCLGRRFVDCEACGGKFHRPIFRHVHTTVGALLSDRNSPDISSDAMLGD